MGAGKEGNIGMLKDDYEKVYLNKYGYYELKSKVSSEERKDVFENQYFQDSMSSYETQYSKEEEEFIQIKLKQKQYIIEKNLKQKSPEKPVAFLDVGCGEGFALSYFNKCGYEVTGIDFSQWAVKHHNPEMLKFLLQGDCVEILPQLKKENKGYDIINMDSSLDMMVNPRKVVELCKDIINPDGIMCIKVANNYSMLQTKLLEEGKLKKEYWLDDPGHPSYFNRLGLIAFFKDCGFDCVDFYGESFIDLNLLNVNTNYYENPSVGKSCFNAKMELEKLMHNVSLEKTMQVYGLLGEMDLGREMIGVFRKRGSNV